MRPTWNQVGPNTWVGTAAGRSLTVRIQVRRREADFSIDVQRRYLRPVFVISERLALTWPCEKAWFWDRSERLRPLGRRASYHVDRWTWRHFRAESNGRTWRLAGTGPLSGAWYRRWGRICRITLELDDARNHPVRYAARCKRRWYPPSPRRRRDRRHRPQGEAPGTWMLLRTGPGLDLVPERLPEPYRAAIVFADHADQSAEGPLRALLLGRSDATVEKPAGGFVGHGLHLTKTLFWRRGYEPQWSLPSVQSLARRAATRGIEFGPHSPTPYRDGRPEVERALASFAGLGETWIDHQPDTNCEAYSCRGWQRSSRWFLADLLYRFGFRYVWTGQDVRLGRRINMFLPARPSARPAILFPFHVAPGLPGRLWLWRSVWLYLGPRALNRRLSERRLVGLVADHGLLVAHTYLDDHHPPRHRRHRFANVLRENGVWVLHPDFERVLARLEAFQRARGLWVPSLAELAGHLRRWAQLRVEWLDPQQAAVSGPRGSLENLRLRIVGKPVPVAGPASIRRDERGPYLLVQTADQRALLRIRGRGRDLDGRPATVLREQP